jgi:aspartate/tyrosine/aromatic aminotransferase
MIVDANPDNEYLPVEGNVAFIEAAKKLAFGDAFYAKNGPTIGAC